MDRIMGRWMKGFYVTFAQFSNRLILRQESVLHYFYKVDVQTEGCKLRNDRYMQVYIVFAH